MKHVLLDKARKYDARTDAGNLTDYDYCNKKGYWVNKHTGKPLMTDPAIQKPASKKADIETGEDKKGE